MSAGPARFQVEEVTQVDASGVTWRQYGAERHLSVDELSNGELNRACAVRFPAVNGKAWFGVTKDDKALALRSGIVPDSATIGAKVPSEPEPSTMNEPATMNEPSEPEPAEQAEPVKAEQAGSIEQAIRDLVQSTATAVVDESKVREIAAQVLSESVAELLDEVSRPQVTSITIPERPTVTIEGRQHGEFANVVKLAGLQRNVWLTGPAGTGKTKMAEMVAKSLGLPFYTLSCDPTMQRSTLFGFVDAGGTYRETLFRTCYEQGGVFLLDEIDNSHPSILAGLNQSAANGMGAFPDGMVKRHPDCIIMAAANTFGTGPTDEYVGRSKIDAATINRFFRVFIGTDEALETELVHAHLSDVVKADRWLSMVRKAREGAARHGLRVLVTMRDAIEGAIAVEAGFDPAQVAEWRWLAGLVDDDRRKVGG